MDKDWRSYINGFPVTDDYYIVPVALDDKGIKHTIEGCLINLNCVRAFEWPKSFIKEYAILFLSHELYRYGLNQIKHNRPGIESSVCIFLSHAKKGDTGLKHALAIKQFLVDSNIQQFFDVSDISPGFKFDEEIERHIKDSTIIAIESDAYSSKYWCQREILSAKRERRPIILVNSLEEYEDRVFPAASNIPCVHVTAEPLEEKDILRILIAALLETIRFKHAHELIRYYQQQGWIDQNAEIFARPPEIQQIVDILKERKSDDLVICYPEPPLYKEETEWTDFFKITVSTPLWSSRQDDDNDKGFRIGLSISDYKSDDYETNHLDLDELKRFSQTLARHLLARHNTLIYGGDLREDGFTQFILDEASVLRDRLQEDQLLCVENFLAWPLYTKEENKSWYANYFTVVKPVFVDLPKDVQCFISDNEKDKFLKPDCPKNKYIWSRCLTKMREDSISSSDVRVFAGGKCEGYLGKMPGVLEEFLISYEKEKPIFLVGGLGGLTNKLCNSIIDQSLTEEFTGEWQNCHNADYEDLQEFAARYEHSVNYERIKLLIQDISIKTLADRVGLSCDDYTRLMLTPFVDECVHLILKGLKYISSNELREK